MPNIFLTTPMVTVFVAGPAERNTKAAPAETPESISPAAIGRDAVAQTYIGTAMMITIRYESQVYSLSISERFSGIATVMSAPRRSPQKSGFAISPRRVIKAYFMAAVKEKAFFFVVFNENSLVCRSGCPHPDTLLMFFSIGVRTPRPIGFKDLVFFVASSLSKILVKIPAIIAIIIEVITRYSVKIHPNIPYVASMESIPVMGVEMRKESVAPLLAPDFLIDVARGITPQEHTGRGIPKMVDLSTEEMLSFPKCLVTILSGTISCKIPANARPKSMYGAIASVSCQSASKKYVISKINPIYKVVFLWLNSH